MIYIDGDFQSGKACQFHVSPTCHPCQIGSEWVYGCGHPTYKDLDWCPIVNCDGDVKRCEIDRIELTREEERELFGDAE